MFPLQLRAGQHPFSLINIASVMNAKEKLKSRHEFPPKKFCEIMKIMEHWYGGKDFVTNKDSSLLLPGTFYLTEVDSKYRRFYAQRDFVGFILKIKRKENEMRKISKIEDIRREWSKCAIND